MRRRHRPQWRNPERRAAQLSRPGDNRGQRAISPCRWKCATRRRGWKFAARTAPARCSCWIPAASSGGPASSRPRPPKNEQPLLSDVYYLERALAPFAEAQKGTICGLIARHVSVLFLADIGKIGGSDADAVNKFVEQWRRAGALRRTAHDRRRRCAGAGAAAGRRALSGQRHGLGPAAESGALSAPPARSTAWRVPDEVTVSRQILAEPSAELSDRSLGAAGRRHAAGHRPPARPGLDRAVSRHRQSGLVVAAAVGTLCGHAQAHSGAVGGHARRPIWRSFPAWRRSACWMALAACRRPADLLPIAAKDFAKHRSFRQASARPLWRQGRGKRAQ